jgi:hypothetical protein
MVRQVAHALGNSNTQLVTGAGAFAAAGRELPALKPGGVQFVHKDVSHCVGQHGQADVELVAIA